MFVLFNFESSQNQVQRVVSGDVQFVQYHYKGGQLPPGPPGHGPNPHMNSPDSGIGDAALNQGYLMLMITKCLKRLRNFCPSLFGQIQLLSYVRE